MKFYISEETKAELEAAIKALEKAKPIDEFESNCIFGRKQELKDVLSKCIVLPILPNYQDAGIFSMKHDREYCEKKYPKGIIINHKKSRK